jgi:hypothetical protein
MSTLPSWERGRRWSWKAARRSGDPFHRPFMIYGTRSGRCARRPVPARDGLSPSTACLCVALQYCTGWFSCSGNGQRPSNWKVARMTKHATAVPCALPVPAEAAIGSSNLSARARKKFGVCSSLKKRGLILISGSPDNVLIVLLLM